MNEKILIIDDEQDICLLIKGLLEDEGYEAFIANNSDQAYEIIEKSCPDIVIQDIWLQGSDEDGIDILKSVKKKHPNIAFIMISGHGTIETAVSAIKLGAYDFIEKPFKSDRLLLMVQRAIENSKLKKQNIALKKQANKKLLGASRQIADNIRQTLDKVALSNSRILITGEVGTGKNIAAQYVHEKSKRSDKPFMVLNCAAMDFEKLENELFGSFDRVGLLELVDGGTLLLDEVMNLPIETQGKILILLQDSSYYKIGSNNKIPVDIRVIATTSANVEDKLSNGLFREDLYYRLNVVPIHMPSLRERREDIKYLIEDYLPNKFTENALLRMQNYKWEGNIKQLHNVLEWISIMNDDPNIVIDVDKLPPEFQNISHMGETDEAKSFINDMMQMGLREARECFERHYLLSQVNRFGGNISKTAAFIGMERSALHRKLKLLGVSSDDNNNKQDSKQNVA